MNIKCVEVGLCRSAIGQSVDICLLNCTENDYDVNTKGMEGFAVELKMNPQCKALWKHVLVLFGSSMAADS